MVFRLEKNTLFKLSISISAVPSMVFSSTLPLKPSAAHEMQPALLKQGESLMLQFPALVVLGAYIEQPHGSRPALIHHSGHIQAAHMGELEEHIRAALHIGAGIDEHKGPLIGGSDGGQRRP